MPGYYPVINESQMSSAPPDSARKERLSQAQPIIKRKDMREVHQVGGTVFTMCQVDSRLGACAKHASEM